MLQWLQRIITKVREQMTREKSLEEKEKARQANERIKEIAEGGPAEAIRRIQEAEDRFWRK